MPWRALSDPDNPENRNAGNGGDLVKHTVYLTLLDFLLAREPWRSGTVVRECHAGRGIYHLDAEREALVARLLALDEPLARAQRAIVGELAVDGAWYAGSALLVAHALANGTHAYHGYEWDPATRRILATVLASLTIKPRELLVPCAHETRHFDGESHLAENLERFGPHDVVLMDPFGLWLHDKHAFRRERFRRILTGWSDRPLALFWTWGRAHDAAHGDLEEEHPRVADGYVALAQRLRDASRPRIVVRWTWELAFAMWLVVPPTLMEELYPAVATACRSLFDALAPPEATLAVRIER